MKVPFVVCSAAWLLACTSAAQAASSVDLSVTGVITPSACAPSLSEGGRVDFGKISAKDLALYRTTELPPVTLKLSVNCEARTLFALNGRDNRQGSAHYFQPLYYGLGLVNGNQKLGSYEIGVFNPVSDVPVVPLLSFDHGQTWLMNSFGSYMGHDYWNAFGDSLTPKALQNVTVDLRISTSIAPARNLTLTDEVPLDGSATLDVVYL
ncbi:DUF1120 domain-containing protein [Pseudomonas costantinii]|uniref:DUF1120 domain-containing protein n=1 Tax=Pseudomonas costantinii TaxID=168469 RepID=UPI0015A05348|nr:DUF1120 domain-containing protein [Pseudomonas costantinii]NVZ22930.1 DUF1120 domain-containing protein [Pseudomonas costantinii]